MAKNTKPVATEQKVARTAEDVVAEDVVAEDVVAEDVVAESEATQLAESPKEKPAVGYGDEQIRIKARISMAGVLGTFVKGEEYDVPKEQGLSMVEKSHATLIIDTGGLDD